jgi:integrase|tara:strand:- start:1968 stop:2936 length:969 start_codon:yes stop_codon:yes gene_type:complete
MLTEINDSLLLSESEAVKEKLREYREIFDELPANTQRAYTSDLKHFLAWCHTNKVDSFKPDFAHNKILLKAYFKSLIGAELARGTINRRKAPLSKFLKILDWPNPFEEVLFKAWLSVSLKNRPAFQHQAMALTHDLLAVINSKLDESCPLELRDKVMLNIMFDGLLRASELCALQCKDISFMKKTFFLAKSKTDKEGQGTYRPLSDTSLKLIERWKSEFNVTDGYLLRSLTPSKNVTERGLQYSSVYEAYKRFSGLVNIDDELFTTHSARVGGAVSLAEFNCNLLEIQRAGGWKTATMPARYTEQTNVHQTGMGTVIKKLGR